MPTLTIPAAASRRGKAEQVSPLLDLLLNPELLSKEAVGLAREGGRFARAVCVSLC